MDSGGGMPVPDSSGLARHPSLDDRFDPAVRIVAHDPAWPVRARAEMVRISDALRPEAIRVEHVGSTAVPGLSGKPILDLQLSVSRIAADAPYVDALQRLGYLFVPDPASPDFQLFAKPAGRPRVIHLHACEAGSAHETRHLAVRDFLRAHAGEARRYEALKRGLMLRAREDRLAYIAGKEEYVDALEERALAWVAQGGR